MTAPRRALPAAAAMLLAACTAPSPGPVPPPARPAEAVAALVPAAASASDPGERDRPADRSKRRQLRFIHTKAERSIRPSLYRGKWFRHKDELKRRCIVWRESNGRYRVTNPSSSAAGAYQFIRSTSDYVARDLIGRPGLVGVPASEWPRRTQDRAFWRLWNNGKGAHHWRGGNWSCGF